MPPAPPRAPAGYAYEKVLVPLPAETRNWSFYLKAFAGASVVAVVVGMYFNPDDTMIVLITINSVVWGVIRYVLAASVKFFYWSAEQVNLGMTMRKATPCAPHMCPQNQKIAGVFMKVVDAQTAAFDCAPIKLTGANANFMTRHLGFLTNSPHSTQLKCYTSYDINGDERRTCTPTDELARCKGAVNWPNIEEDMRDVLALMKNHDPQCKAGKGIENQASQQRVAAVTNAASDDSSSNGSPLCDSNVGVTKVVIQKQPDGSPWNVAMKKLIEEWAPDISWADVLRQPHNFCKSVTTMNMAIIKVDEVYCPEYFKQLEENFLKVIDVIRSNRGRHPKEIELLLPGLNDTQAVLEDE